MRKTVGTTPVGAFALALGIGSQPAGGNAQDPVVADQGWGVAPADQA